MIVYLLTRYHVGGGYKAHLENEQNWFKITATVLMQEFAARQFSEFLHPLSDKEEFSSDLIFSAVWIREQMSLRRNKKCVSFH